MVLQCISVDAFSCLDFRRVRAGNAIRQETSTVGVGVAAVVIRAQVTAPKLNLSRYNPKERLSLPLQLLKRVCMSDDSRKITRGNYTFLKDAFFLSSKHVLSWRAFLPARTLLSSLEARLGRSETWLWVWMRSAQKCKFFPALTYEVSKIWLLVFDFEI